MTRPTRSSWLLRRDSPRADEETSRGKVPAPTNPERRQMPGRAAHDMGAGQNGSAMPTPRAPARESRGVSPFRDSGADRGSGVARPGARPAGTLSGGPPLRTTPSQRLGEVGHGLDTEQESADSNESWALVRAAQAGDMSAFSELFDRYHDVVFRYVLFRMGDRTLAEDITQETFLRALRRIGSVSYQGRDIGAWFITIARNLVFDHVKSSRYRLEQTTSEIVELAPSTSGPEQKVVDNATYDELLRCIRKLNPDQQECINLRFLQGLSVAETARIMNRNEGAVKALQHRAVRRLAQLLPEGLR